MNLIPAGDGTYITEYEWRTFRFMMEGGKVIDVRAVQDDSNLRAEVLKVHAVKDGRIVGATWVPDEPVVEETPKPVRRRPAKKQIA